MLPHGRYRSAGGGALRARLGGGAPKPRRGSRAPAGVGRAPPQAAAWALRVLWRFGRPHTLIGTSLSIVGLYVIAASLERASSVVDLLWTLLAGLCGHVFITGINQIEDVEIDRLNKPWLPIAAGDLSLEAARRPAGGGPAPPPPADR